MSNERKAQVGDKIVLTHTIGYEIDPVVLTIESIDDRGDFFTKEVYEDHENYEHNVVMNSCSLGANDTWHFADESPNYDDEQIAESYREAAAKGKTLSDYTGVEITKESLAFKPEFEKVLDNITPQSLSFEEKTEDVVNHPNHYNSGKFETIEMIEEITKGYDDGYVAYCVGNAIKYLSRAPHKHATPNEDLSKAAKYLEFAIDYLNEK